MKEINQIYNEDCLIGIKDVADNSIDMVVTSPPYDNLRTYNKNIDKIWSENVWKPLIKELFRVMKPGGVVVWVVNDATINGSETGTSFRQALFFMESGFNLHDTMIYQKQNPLPLGHNRYEQCFEYMFAFSKGKPKTFNPIRIPCKYAGQTNFGERTVYATNDGKLYEKGKKCIKNDKIKTNIFTYLVGSLTESAGVKHPAMYPLQLAIDQIKSWSNENDLVLDPFMGSGTTAVACKRLGRNYIGFELNTDFYNDSLIRIKTDVFEKNETIQEKNSNVCALF